MYSLPGIVTSCGVQYMISFELNSGQMFWSTGGTYITFVYHFDTSNQRKPQGYNPDNRVISKFTLTTGPGDIN